MYEQILTPRATPVVTPEQLAEFGRFDVPEKYVPNSSPQVKTVAYSLLETFIEAATDEVEHMSCTACITEQIQLTFDFFPGQQDPRNLLNYELGYAYNVAPWWWYGFPTKDSIELVRRPVLIPIASPVTNPVVVTYRDADGALQTFDSANYTVFADKITLNVGSTWPVTDRRQDCVQISYYAGFGVDAIDVPARLKMAVMFLASHFWENRSIISVDPTSEVGLTLCRILSSYRSTRVPR